MNQDILDRLKKYVPEGYLQDSEHVPVCGHGCWYQDADGKNYIDFSSGIFTNTFGHGCRRLVDAGANQSMRLSNIHGRHSKAELMLYERLFPYLPADDYKAIPYNDGGYAIDRGLTDIINFYGKSRISIGAYQNGFHGKTQAGKLLINETQKAAFFDNFQLKFPYCYRCPWHEQKENCDLMCVKDTCKNLLERDAKALIFELVQGAGIIIPPKKYWKEIEDFCRKHDILMFADEVLTGGGRVGRYLASSYFDIVPDMIALTKGLANGKPLSLLLEREFITQNPFAIRSMERSSTFAAHPEALAVAAEVLEMIREENLIEHVQVCGEFLKQEIGKLAEKFEYIGDVRCLGLMAAIEFVTDRKSKQPFTDMGQTVFRYCRKNGLEVISSGHIIRLAPPLIVNYEDIAMGIEKLKRSMEEAEYEISS